MPDSRHNGELGNLNEDMWKLKIADNNQEGGDDDQQNQYPDRPGKPDCIFYLKTGTCGFGSTCKYNHPTSFSGQSDHVQGTMYRDELPQRDGQPDCQFFLKTGFCKFASSCKYHHPQDKHDGQRIQLNSLGFPMRKNEKSCPHYMRTTSCKFGVACKFNHPEPSTFGAMASATGTSAYGAPQAAPPVIGGSSPWVLPGNHPRVQGPPAYMPVVLPPNAVQQGWSPYMSNVGIPIVDAFGSPHMPNSNYHVQPGSSTPVGPEKPDQPECQYYLRTGNCKYGTACRYNHPQERNRAAAGPLGLPLRPGLPACASYTRFGSCKYGSACKYDHPIMGYYNYPPVFAIQEPPVLLVNPSSLILSFAENSSSKTASAADKPVKSEKIIELHDTESSEHDDPSSQTSPSHVTPQSDSQQNQSD